MDPWQASLSASRADACLDFTREIEVATIAVRSSWRCLLGTNEAARDRYPLRAAHSQHSRASTPAGG